MEIKGEHQRIMKKHQVLSKTRKQLKKEFVGIDNVIDQVMDLCSSWYLLPQLQDKPVVINLWGLTGVGKSSLVNRLAELIGFNEKYFRFDLGDKEKESWKIKGELETIYENDNGFPIMLAFDEFQHAKTLDFNSNEMVNSTNRIIWELLDSGKFMITRWFSMIDEIYDITRKLKYALSKGVKVKNGIVIQHKQVYRDILNLYKEDHEKESIDILEYYFVPKKYYPEIYEILKMESNYPQNIGEHLEKLDGIETIEFLEKVLDCGKSPKTIDCSKALIFVLGNLDEAYTMSSSYNPDMDADEFHQQSLKINISNVKQALRLRFRNEQIARLGNNHIIYPAFGKETFKNIISLELVKISNKIKAEYKIDLNFDNSIHDLIYKEGVYPTQGTRPVFSTIYLMVSSKIGKMICEIYLNNLEVDTISMSTKNNEISVSYFNKSREVFTFSQIPTLDLSKLRKNKQDDLQAIVAVHETGHALISIFLLKTIPEVIYSKTADANSDGFVYTDFKWKYISKKEIVSRIAFYLGGIIAEKIIFGEENITSGSESDIEKATIFTTKMLKESGMGNQFGNYQVPSSATNNYLFDIDNSINIKVGEFMEQAEQLAFHTLKQQEHLLIQIASFLSDNRTLNKEKIKEYLIKYGKDFDINDMIENGDFLFYRNHLKQKAEGIKPSSNLINSGNGFSLNKESLK